METSKVLLLSLFLLFSASPCPSVLAEKVLSSADFAAVGFENSNSAVYIVFLNPSNVVATESMHIDTLSSILGGQESAKKAMIYSYKNTVHGFAARLTPEQAAELAADCVLEFNCTHDLVTATWS
ncbi:hypothetical protein KSP40_PGU011580 [Platanthera guangdongensis]|uniref:Inhibitor I9 domain-containing protein n=1 Tax=Platanthera guangdongensis TaxID=2320717 RepID=A0ABR2MU32_9ASPA